MIDFADNSLHEAPGQQSKKVADREGSIFRSQSSYCKQTILLRHWVRGGTFR